MDATGILSSIDERTAAELRVENAREDWHDARSRMFVAPPDQQAAAQADERAASLRLMQAERAAAALLDDNNNERTL